MELFADLQVAPRFWELIGSAQGDPERLRILLSSLSRDDLARFSAEFDYATDDLVSHVVEDLGDGHREQEIAGWVITQGLRHYARVYDNPDEFPAELPDGVSSLRGVAEVVFEERFREGAPDCNIERWPTIQGRGLLR